MQKKIYLMDFHYVILANVMFKKKMPITLSKGWLYPPFAVIFTLHYVQNAKKYFK